MKKTSLLFLLLLSAFSFAQAQISKGSIWLGGNIGFASAKNEWGESSKNTYYSFSPALGIAVKKNTVIGIQLNADRATFKNESNDQSTIHYGVDVFERKYWTILNRLYAFGHFRAGYTSEKKESIYTSSSEEINGWSVGLGAAPGISFELSKRFQLETMFYDLLYINYRQSKMETTNVTGNSSYESHSISGGINFENTSNVTLGIRFLINK